MITVNFTHPVYTTLSDRPAAAVFGEGSCTVDGVVYTSNGVEWSDTIVYREEFKKKLLNSLSRKSATRQYWDTTVAAWTTLEAVYVGEIRSSNGHWYVASAAGTCGAFAPDLIHPLLSQPFERWYDGAADGSGTSGVPWVYYSEPVTTNYTDGETVSITVTTADTTDAALTKTYTPVTGSATGANGTTNVVHSGSKKLFKISGGASTVAFASWVGDCIKSQDANVIYAAQTPGGSLGLNFSTGQSTNAANQVAAKCIEINTDSLVIQLKTPATGNMSTAGWSMILVDGVQYRPSKLISTAAATGNTDLYTKITFAGLRKTRNIKFIGFSNIREIKLTSNSQLHTVEDPVFRCLWLGDSKSVGAAPGPSIAHEHWPNLLARNLGISNGYISNLAIGGTGVETYSGASYSYYDKINESASSSALQVPNSVALDSAYNNYDMIVVQVSQNDTSTSGTLQNAYYNLLIKLRQLQPLAIIFVVDDFASISNNTGATLTRSTKAQAAFSAFNDVNSFYIKTLADAKGGPWIDGTGYCKSGFTSAIGNSSFYCGNDFIHPNDAGIRYMAKRTAMAICELFGINYV